MSRDKITLQLGLDGVVHKARKPAPDADHALVDGLACPGCKAPAPLKVQGTGRRIESRDTYAADAVTACCSGWVGTLRLKVDTLFGLEEDEAVASLGIRIY